MVIEINEVGNVIKKTGTTFHYGVVTIDGNPYDFSICEMYEDNTGSADYEVSIEDYDGEFDESEFIEELGEVVDLYNMSHEETLQVALANRVEINKLKESVETGIYPHNEGETYLCESKVFVFFRDENYQALVVYRKMDNKRFEVDDVNVGILFEEVEEGEIIKMSPDFIYDYQEILKELKDDKDA